MASNSEQADIPVIDISSPSAAIAHSVLDAAAAQGFLFIRNHGIGIPPEDIQSMFNVTRDFFQSPVEVKQEASIHSSTSGKNRGWISMHTEKLDPANHKRGDFKEAFNLGSFVDGKADQPLPAPLAKEEARIATFSDQCHALCERVLRLFAQALEIPNTSGGQDWFSEKHDRSQGPCGNVLRLLYYPALEKTKTFNQEEDIRAGAHSDYGSVTLLFRLPGQPGLEILTPSSKWAAVPLNPHDDPELPILLNIGDLLSYWTNGLLKSTIHRVVFPPPSLLTERGASEDRYSIAYFCHPLDSARLVPVPSKSVEERKDWMKENGIGFGGGTGAPGEDGEILTAKGHLDRRLRATYGLKN